MKHERRDELPRDDGSTEHTIVGTIRIEATLRIPASATLDLELEHLEDDPDACCDWLFGEADTVKVLGVGRLEEKA